MSLYTPGDTKGSFIIDADISYIHGEPLEHTGGGRSSHSLEVEILIDEVQLKLQHTVNVNSTSNEFVFPLRSLAPRSQPYGVTLKATRSNGGHVYTAATQVYHLPERTDAGSVTKVDSLFGGLLYGHATLLLVEQIFSFDSISWAAQNVPALNGMIVGLVVLGILLQAVSAPEEEAAEKKTEERRSKSGRLIRPTKLYVSDLCLFHNTATTS